MVVDKKQETKGEITHVKRIFAAGILLIGIARAHNSIDVLVVGEGRKTGGGTADSRRTRSTICFAQHRNVSIQVDQIVR